jgi:hypothetical protein
MHRIFEVLTVKKIKTLSFVSCDIVEFCFCLPGFWQNVLPLCTAEVTKIKDVEDLDRLVYGVSLRSSLLFPI